MQQMRDTCVLALKYRLEIEHPGLFTSGWRLEPNVYAICGKLEAVWNETDIQSWIDDERPADLVVRFTQDQPEGGAVQLEIGNIDPYVVPRPRSAYDLWNELLLEASSVPLTGLTVNNDHILLHTNRELDDAENSQLQSTLQLMGIHETVHVVSDGLARKPSRPNGLLTLVTKHELLSPAIKDLAGRDEAFWLSTRQNLVSPRGMGAQNPIGSQSRCFIDGTTFAPLDLRNYLCLYETIFLALPLKGLEKQFVAGLGVSVNELAELVARNRVKIVLTHSLHCYDEDLIRACLEVDASAIIGPRQLAALSLIDFYQRNPILFDPIYSQFRSQLRRSLIETTHLFPPAMQPITSAMAQWLGRTEWGMRWSLNLAGASAFGGFGIGTLMGDLLRALEDANPGPMIELNSAGVSVHMAAGLGATLFPVLGFSDAERTEISYSSELPSQLVASLYMGAKGRPIDNYPTKLDTLVQGLTTVDSKTPVLELADAISIPEVRRLQKLCGDLLHTNPSIEEITAIISDYNRRIPNFLGRQSKVQNWDLLGFAAGNLSEGFVSWLLSGLIKHTVNKGLAFGRHRSLLMDVGADLVTAAVTMSPPDVVLVARLRNKIRGMRR